MLRSRISNEVIKRTSWSEMEISCPTNQQSDKSSILSNRYFFWHLEEDLGPEAMEEARGRS